MSGPSTSPGLSRSVHRCGSVEQEISETCSGAGYRKRFSDGPDGSKPLARSSGLLGANFMMLSRSWPGRLTRHATAEARARPQRHVGNLGLEFNLAATAVLEDRTDESASITQHREPT